MKKYEVIYDWPISEINRLSDSETAEKYADSLPEPTQSNFVTLTEKMRILGAEIALAKAGRVHFQKWGELRNHIKTFSDEFGTFPTPSVEKLKLSLLLAEKIFQSSAQLDNDDINADLFCLRELTQSLPQSWFCRENSLSLEDSIVLFPGSNLDLVTKEIELSTISPNLLFSFMATLHCFDALPSSQVILVKKTSSEIDASAINAFVRLSILSTGKPVHSARKYTSTLSILDPDGIKSDLPYQQWADVLNVISEYNSREEILLKYLTIYHVIENFMFKRPIVELERQMNGEMFSIRDFRRLYDSIDINESDALKKVFTSVFKMPAKGTINFSQHLIGRWKTLESNTLTQTKINDTLQKFGLNTSFNGFKGDAAPSFFSKLVYAVRNSIVHNKETEFHLTYASLDSTPALCALIENFLLPSLEEICFSLISRKNSEFWYQNKDLSLYK